MIPGRPRDKVLKVQAQGILTYLPAAIHLDRLNMRGVEGRGANKNLKIYRDLVRTTVLIKPNHP
jgi:hypothetical protein